VVATFRALLTAVKEMRRPVNSGTHAWKAISSKTPNDEGDVQWAAPNFDDSAWPKSVWAPYHGDRRCLAVGAEDPRTLLADATVQQDFSFLDVSDRPKSELHVYTNDAVLYS
jgi:hypothetical protein